MKTILIYFLKLIKLDRKKMVVFFALLIVMFFAVSSLWGFSADKSVETPSLTFKIVRFLFPITIFCYSLWMLLLLPFMFIYSMFESQSDQFFLIGQVIYFYFIACFLVGLYETEKIKKWLDNYVGLFFK